MERYVCKKCGNEREGLLPADEHGFGYSWECPECGSSDIERIPVVPDGEERSTNAWWNIPSHPGFIVVGPVFMEEMRRQWAILKRTKR